MTSLESNLSTVIKELQDLISESVRIPAGAVQYFATETAPDGWLKQTVQPFQGLNILIYLVR